ncbi:MAG TPA: (2Fe-2S)-binding protein [Propionibacterium sp.]|jgi:bacterioferritin-associated ferredoxin|nr:(2Fe-2S)-binding protein [Propionibacterium sp.]
MIVCHCEVVSDRQIRKAIGNGAKCPREIGIATGAGTECGNCLPSIAGLLTQYAGVAPSDREERNEAPQCSCCRVA